MKKLARYLKQARIDANLTQRDVAREIGYSTPQHLSNIERGLSPVSMSLLSALTKLYKLPKKKTFNLYVEECSRKKWNEFLKYSKS